ncbi:MAG TPA: triose-phosphate isomerase [Candidatus Paceibacterota bacterium]|nr:triose-phosphate isomerase [Candidatus Paceibacterota bacterium]HRY76611.1 triose-phosphate isomerase [Candidatus Paceibacterota bacterium]
MKKLVIANFKMNPATAGETSDLVRSYGEKAKALEKVEFVAAPPFIFLLEILNKGLEVAAQDCFYEDSGAYTGEISPLALQKLGVQYVIIGHSERRRMGETDEIIGKKLQAAIRNGLIPVLCVGETQAEKEAGQREAVLKQQLSQALGNWASAIRDFQLVVAYEPIWAIGTGLACEPDEANRAMEFILNETKKIIKDVKMIIIYGGSVDANNLKGFLVKPNISGALVGGASLKKEEFAKILEIANSV